MKTNIYIVIFLATTYFFSSCDKETNPIASDDLEFVDKFTPSADEHPTVLRIFDEYEVWIRAQYEDITDMTVGIIGSNTGLANTYTSVDEKVLEQVMQFADTLMSNVSKEFAKTYFPVEICFAQRETVGVQVTRINRARLFIGWYDLTIGTVSNENPENHYYQDSVIVRDIWYWLGSCAIANTGVEIPNFASSGNAYNIEPYNNIIADYNKDQDIEKRDAALAELARTGGFLVASACGSYSTDVCTWFRLLNTESYENIKAEYLDNSPARTMKYEALVKFCNEYGYDIQGNGNKFRRKFNEYKTSKGL